jgi:hypothetical protein
MNDKPKSKWPWRLLRWGLIGVATMVTLVAVLVTEEDWRGKHDWEAYQRQAAARGDSFDDLLFNSRKFPDDQNFAKAPIFSDLTNLQWNARTDDWEPSDTNSSAYRWKTSIYRSDGSSPEKATGDFTHSRLTDLKAWQVYYRTPKTNSIDDFPMAPQPQSPAADVLLALSKFDQPVEELRSASLRPYSRFGDYDFNDLKSTGELFAYLSDMKRYTQIVELRALAERAGGQSTNAFEDVKLLSRMNDKMRQEPLLISHLVSVAMMNLVLQPIYEGLARHQWSDAQLAELEQMLAAKDFLADFQTAMRGERACAISTFENLRLTRQEKIEDPSNTGSPTTISYRWMPAAFFYQNELNFAQCESRLLSLVDVEKHLASPAEQRRVNVEFTEALKHYNPYKILAVMSAQSLPHSVINFALTQSWTDCARTACALERYRLAHGNYPDNLDALAPQFIDTVPHDVINGQPLHYHRTPDGLFILYSVGWDETDNNGQVVFNKHGAIDKEKSNWVWQYPIP